MLFKEHCFICGNDKGFEIESDKVLYREAKCNSCGGAIRNSDIAKIILDKILNNTNSLKESIEALKPYRILGTARTGIINQYLSELPHYISGEYFDDIPSGEFNEENIQCIDLQNLPFDEKSFDFVISEDVLEHVKDIDKAFKEINRVLRVNGAHIFTIPFHEGRKTVCRHNKVQIFHGDPLRKQGALVYYDFGEDLVEKLEYYGMNTENILCHKYYESSEITDSDKEYEKYIILEKDLLKFFKYNSNVFYSKKERDIYSITFTGERFIPQFCYKDEIEIEHMQRYLAIERIVSGKIVVDAACGEGYGSNIIAKNAEKVYGIDISEEAIRGAREKYKRDNIEFIRCGIDQMIIPNNSIDVVVSFETIEHVDEIIQNKFMLEVKRILKPEGLLIISTPDKKNYSDLLNYNNEFHVKEFYKDEFLSFLQQYFSNVKLYNQGYEVTSIMSEYNAKSLKVMDDIVDIESKYIIAVCSKHEQEDNNLMDDSIIVKSKGEYFNNIKRIMELQDKLQELNTWGETLNKEKNIYIEKINIMNNDILTQRKTMDIYEQDIEKYEQDIQELKFFHEKKLSEVELEKQNIHEMYLSVFKTATQYQEALQSIYNSNMWKVASRYYRFRGKLDSYIPFLRKKNKRKEQSNSNDDIEHMKAPEENNIESFEFEETAYNNRSKQDIIILSVIDWDFRYQRPQHIAEKFQKLNHRVFYFNANYFENKLSIKEIENNLYSITLGSHYGERIYDIDFTVDERVYKQQLFTLLNKFGIREASVIVEYPTWGPVAKHLKENYGFNILFDYIDDYTGFEDTVNSKLHSFTEQLFKISDVVIATSNFLETRALQFSSNVEIVRNGTEFDFFNKAIDNKTKEGKMKIGYYGAIAEWFDLEKIEYIAKKRPEYEIELIGNVTNTSCSSLKKYKNVKFLGEKPYKELPNYLRDYDVCLIPFKSDIDLIKATNPVKFYEYLSAGKKIVATEIPELEPYRDKYVYLANDKEKFLEYVDLCVKKKDSLCDSKELITFAKNQDWCVRVKAIEDIIRKYTPLVSIIMVTYNNVKYTKQCIESILSKTAYPNYEIIIVDNDSKDETREYLKNISNKYENIKIVLNDDNLGFAGGNNVGIQKSNGDYIILLNNDTIVTNGWMTSLIKHLNDPKLGMVCPVTNSIGNEAQINVNYNKIEEMDNFALEYTTKNQGKLYYDINVLAMFCVAIKRNVLDKVGYLDENYEVGMFEDDDYSFSLKKSGYIVACAEDVFIHHFGSVSFKKLNDSNYRKIFEKNKKYYESKWNTVWVPHKYRDGVNPN